MTALRTLALVESPTQLLNVIEWAHATGEGRDLRVAVLSPKDAPGRDQLLEVVALAEGAGLDVDVVDIRALGPSRSGGSGMLGGVRLTRSLASARRVVLGDPFSGLIQALLPFVRASHLAVVDDGTATWEFASCIDRGTPMVRWRLDPNEASSRAVRATRLLSPSANRTLTVFSCLDGATPSGAVSLTNDYAWTKAWTTPLVTTERTDLLGTSLVETGMVDRGAYLGAVRGLAARFGPLRYLAHRRESEERLAELATVPGVRVQRGRLPVELALRRGPVAAHVITFPSTAAHTLPLVLDDLDVRVEVKRIDDAWFTPDTSTRAREFVGRISTDAPARTLLEPV